MDIKQLIKEWEEYKEEICKNNSEMDEEMRGKLDNIREIEKTNKHNMWIECDRMSIGKKSHETRRIPTTEGFLDYLSNKYKCSTTKKDKK